MTTTTYYAVFDGDRSDGTEIITETADAALKEAEEYIRGVITPEDGRTTWWDVELYSSRESEEAIAESTVKIGPPEPKCIDRGDHDWRSPHKIVGGVRENPGVYGHGGGVKIQEVCVKCGCGRLTDTYAQRQDTGEQGLESVTYDPDYYDPDQIDED